MGQWVLQVCVFSFQIQYLRVTDAGAAEASHAAVKSLAAASPPKTDAAHASGLTVAADAIPFGKTSSQHSLASSSKGPQPTDEGDDDSLTFFENGILLDFYSLVTEWQSSQVSYATNCLLFIRGSILLT